MQPNQSQPTAPEATGKHPFFLVVLFLLLPALAAANTSTRATHLTCEYQAAPLGLDTAHPSLGWWLESDQRQVRQTAYRIVVASSIERLDSMQFDYWDSGMVKSDCSTHVEYAGKKLGSDDKVYWRVQIWDREGQPSPWSTTAEWSMGLLEPGDWQARWIAATDQLSAPLPPVFGYHALESKTPDAIKWVQVDLGRALALDQIKLYAPKPSGFAKVKGFGLPVRFKVEASNDDDFKQASLVADFTEADQPNPGNEPLVIEGVKTPSRYVRITATKLWNRGTGPEPFCFALAELEVYSNGTNVALKASARARDGVEGGDWGLKRLTDGIKPDQGKAIPDRPGNAAILMRKEIAVPNRVARATVFMCGLGYSELQINGHKVGREVLDPGFTDFSKRVLYRTFDVTSQLITGTNALGVILGGGWFNLATGDLFGNEHAPWSASPRLLFRMHLLFEDGTAQTIVSDESWKWSTGAITFNCVRAGETIDAREDQPGWNLPGYDARSWMPSVIVASPKGKLLSQQNPPIRATSEIRPVAVTEPKPGVYVFDLGVNLSGWARLITQGAVGTKVSLAFGEKLDQEGTVNMNHNSSHTHGRFQTDEFILNGQGAESFEPRFTYHGFRFVQVSGLKEKPTLDSLIGRWVHTDPASAGDFRCSNEQLNRLQEVFLRTYLNNLHSIPTDCPQREKMGWMDDGCVCVDTACYNFDSPLFYRKWIHDMLDAQDANGFVPDIVPTPGWGRSKSDGAPGEMADPWWGGVIVLAPWKLYQHFGDQSILAEAYPAMKAYVRYLGAHSQENQISWGLGDWLVGTAGAQAPSVQSLSTAAYAYLASTLSQAASVLGNEGDAQRYAAIAGKVRQVFNDQNLNPEDGWYNSKSQTGQALPLALNLVPEESRVQVAERLAESINAHQDGHVGTGIVGLDYLFKALRQIDRNDLAYRMVTREEYPGWLHMLKQGATTVWEDWKGENSLNHPTLGCIGAWFFEGLGGLRPDPAQPGFKHFIIQPAVVGDLLWVNCSHETVFGKISSRWNRQGDRLQLDIEVPANTTATIFVPTKEPASVLESGVPAEKSPGVKAVRNQNHTAVFEVASGRYAFEAPFQMITPRTK